MSTVPSPTYAPIFDKAIVFNYPDADEAVPADWLIPVECSNGRFSFAVTCSNLGSDAGPELHGIECCSVEEAIIEARKLLDREFQELKLDRT
jgi:hypothetical protein